MEMYNTVGSSLKARWVPLPGQSELFGAGEWRGNSPWWTSLEPRVKEIKGGTEHADLPVQDQYTFDRGVHLNDFGGNGDVVEETETHVLVWLCVVARGTDDSKGLVKMALGDFQTSLDDATAA